MCQTEMFVVPAEIVKMGRKKKTGLFILNGSPSRTAGLIVFLVVQRHLWDQAEPDFEEVNRFARVTLEILV